MLAYLARYTHRVAIANNRLISADEAGVTFKWKDYRIEGPGRYKTMTLPTHEFILGASESRAAQGPASHPSLRAVRQRQKPRYPISLVLANCSPCPKAQRSIISIPPPNSSAPRSVKAVPMLRWPHDHHRDLRARLSAQAQSGIDQDRLLMTPSPLIDDRTRTNRSRRRSTGNARARAKPLSLSALTPQTSPRNALACQSPYSPAERLPQPLQSKLIKPAAATKSP